MDTEKYIQQQKKLDQGHSPSDEGPYYHHSWWESYKGATKGEIGGAMIGAMVGAVAGVVAATALALAFPTFGAAGIALTVVGFAGGGMWYGVHKFANVGAITGAVSASQQQSEFRMKAFEQGKFAEIKKDILDIKSMVSGKPVDAQAKRALDAEIAQSEAFDDQYRKTHYAKVETPLKNRYVFWKIALAGLAIGAAVGALIAGSHLGHEVLNGLIAEGGPLQGVNIYAASMATMGAIGASFGINRDVFRKIFDKTDLWFKGIFSSKHHDIVREHQVEAGEQITNGKKTEPEAPQVATAVFIENQQPEASTSSTYHRDRVLAAAQKALLSFDHTRATPH